MKLNFGRYKQYRYLQQMIDLKKFKHKITCYDTYHDTK